MSRIRGRDTGPERRLRRAVWRSGIRYRLRSTLPGRPDLVFRGARVAVFVDGCFWHGCPLHSTIPKTNRSFWLKKIQGNIERDRRVTSQLRAAGWTVLRFWEHEVNESLEECLTIIESAVRKAKSTR